jgi:hypothetical protein
MIDRMLLRSLPFALALTALAGMASAQTMDFACPTPGTTFVFDSGANIVARGQEGMDCKMEIAGGKPFKVRGLLFDNPAADGSDKSAFIEALKPERLWPLAIGKKIEATYSVGGRSWKYILTSPVMRTHGPRRCAVRRLRHRDERAGRQGERSVSRWWCRRSRNMSCASTGATAPAAPIAPSSPRSSTEFILSS